MINNGNFANSRGVFIATLVQSTFGFGQAIIAVPLLALTIPLRIVTPLVVLISITIGTVVVIQDSGGRST